MFSVKVSSLHLDEHGRDKLVRLAEGRLTHAPDPEEEALKQTQIGIEGDTPMNLRKEAFTAVRNITHPPTQSTESALVQVDLVV